MPNLKQTIQREATKLATLCDMSAPDICKAHNIEPHTIDANWHKMIIIRCQSEILLDLLAQAGMYDPETKERDANIVLPDITGKFIAIPVFSAAGRVQRVRWANSNNGQTIEVLLRESPTDPASKWKVFYLNPDEYEIIPYS